MRILLLEDDGMIAEAMRDTLKAAGYSADWVRDGEEAETALAAHDYPLALLDVGVPKKSGLAVLATLRQRRADTAVILVTARDALEERVEGLDLGADDYVVKPFEPEELLARIRAVIRRHAGSSEPLIGNGVLTLNPATREISREGSSHRLSAREYALLHALLLRPGAVLSRQELEERIYGWNEEVESNAVEFLIHSIRKKLGSDAIKNVRGLGWLVPPQA
ncbi:MAG: response regulator transcription factor [Neisseria sp.]|nr:response regulator transcription factor [Neisseria sp.]